MSSKIIILQHDQPPWLFLRNEQFLLDRETLPHDLLISPVPRILPGYYC